MKVIITCGGTGGHITPGLAIADMLNSNVAGCKILFLGTEGGMENTLVKNGAMRSAPCAWRAFRAKILFYFRAAFT